MQLDYQTQGNIDISKQLNKLDKLTSKLTLTLKDIPTQEIIPQRVKNKILKCITKDYAKTLIRTLEQQVVSWHRQIGSKGMNWNVIHLCAKNNSFLCMKSLLKQLYQRQPDQFINAVNSSTSQGFTPLMISIIYQSDKVLELLLHLGGVDLNKFEKGKLRAYDLALHYRNQYAISQLIVYQDRCKKRDFVNEEELLKIQPSLEEKSNCWSDVTSYLFDCLICFKFDEELDKFPSIDPSKNKTCVVDSVKVGSRKDIEDYEIEWMKLSDIQGQKLVLFDGFKPQDICESQFVIKNNLIIFQTLSDFPWLLRSVIAKTQNEERSLKYKIKLYRGDTLQKLEVDEYVPIVKERQELMFLSNRTQIWPMILQKALAKLYGSYLLLNNIDPLEALETLSGFSGKTIPLKSIHNENGFVSALQQITLKGYICLLQARPRTELNTGSELTSYSILNFYEKGNTKKILISCPNIVENWNGCKESRQLAILKSHFSRYHQSCLWIDEDKIDYFFENITILFLKESYLRTDLKVKMKIKSKRDPLRDTSNQPDCIFSEKPNEEKKSLFLKMNIERSKQQPILLKIINTRTQERYDLSQLQGWKNQGSGSLKKEPEHPLCPQLMKIEANHGQYLFKFDIQTKKSSKKNSLASSCGSIEKKQNDESIDGKKKVKLNLETEHLQEIQITAWWLETLQFQVVEQEFGTIEWLSNFRNHVNFHSQHQKSHSKEVFIKETVNKKTMILYQKAWKKRILLRLGDYEASSIMEGQSVEYKGQNFVEMVSQASQKYAYCVLSGVSSQKFDQSKILLVDINNS